MCPQKKNTEEKKVEVIEQKQEVNPETKTEAKPKEKKEKKVMTDEIKKKLAEGSAKAREEMKKIKEMKPNDAALALIEKGRRVPKYISNKISDEKILNVISMRQGK